MSTILSLLPYWKNGYQIIKRRSEPGQIGQIPMKKAKTNSFDSSKGTKDIQTHKIQLLQHLHQFSSKNRPPAKKLCSCKWEKLLENIKKKIRLFFIFLLKIYATLIPFIQRAVNVNLPKQLEREGKKIKKKHLLGSRQIPLFIDSLLCIKIL